LDDLKKEMPYKWRVQSFSEYSPNASCVAYIDARDVMDRLDDVCGAHNWQDDYKVINGLLLAGIGVRDPKTDWWVWKWDTGTESQVEKEKGQMSDAFKRAAVKWGVGRFLYGLEIIKLPANEKKTKNPTNYPYVVDSRGNRVWDITKHINSMKRDDSPSETTKMITKVQFEERLKQAEIKFDEAGLTATFLKYLEDTYGTNNIEQVAKERYKGADAVIDSLMELYKKGNKK